MFFVGGRFTGRFFVGLSPAEAGSYGESTVLGWGVFRAVGVAGALLDAL